MGWGRAGWSPSLPPGHLNPLERAASAVLCWGLFRWDGDTVGACVRCRFRSALWIDGVGGIQQFVAFLNGNLEALNVNFAQ